MGRTVRISLWHVFLLLATSAFAATVVVTTTNVTGNGSITDAVTAVNNGSASEIDFNISPGGAQTIHLGSFLLVFNSVIINGTTQPGYNGTPLIEFFGNGTSGFLNNGFIFPVCCNTVTIQGLAFGNYSSPLIFQAGSTFNIIGNYFGIAPNGTATIPNGNGIDIEGGTGNIGDGTAAGANLISGNTIGIFVNLSSAAPLIAGNFIGVAANHVTAKPNRWGIQVNTPVTIGGTTAGYANTIAFNSTAGITTSVPGMFASQNSIYSNPAGKGILYTIPLPQAAPTLTSAQSTASSTTIAGSVTTSSPSQNVTVEFFSNPVSEQQGKTFLGSTTLTTDGTSNATFSTAVPVSVAGGASVNATATLTSATPNSTSPFSNDVSDTACPIITAQPTSATICAGQTNTFMVSATGTSITYQWQSSPDGITWSAIGGANTTSYTAGAAGFYDVVITNSCSSVTSNPVTLTVDAPPSITTQPSSTTACATQPASFTVAAIGTGLTYQWQKGGVPITGANAATFTIPSTSTTDAGTYNVVVGGTCTPPQTSNNVTLTVNTAPAISTQPANTAACPGQPASFTVVATGTGLTYQWQKGGVNIPGANAATYSIASAAASDAGTYDVIVGGTCAPPATSSNATLTVNAPPAINTQPSPLSLCAGQPATFSVGASGTGLTYQWRKNGVNIAGAISSSYTIPAAALSDNGNYDVVVSGACSTPATSNPASLTVAAPATTISLTMTPAYGFTGQPATFNIMVAGNCAVPTGTVTLSDGPLGTATLNNGSAVITVVMPGPTKSVTVQYNGDSIFPPSSATFAVTVGATIPTLDPAVLALLVLALAAIGLLGLRRL